MKTHVLLAVSLCWACVAQAQSDTVDTHTHIEYRKHDGFFEKLTYNGEKQDYYTISTYLKDSTLYRIDHYQVISMANAYGQQYPANKVSVRQGLTKIMYPTGQLYLTCSYSSNALDGPLTIYYPDGSIKRRELYKERIVKESRCFTPDGKQQPCTPLYQPSQFTGKPKDLRTYLEKNLGPIVDKQQVKDIIILLTINEIGQVINTEVKSWSNPDDPVLAAEVRQVIKNIPQWNPDSLNWKPAMMDGVPLPEIWGVSVAKRKGFLYVNLP